MIETVTHYFEKIVIPMIEADFPELASAMSLQVEGSCGLGIADEHSDLEASLYLEDPVWRKEGGQLQLVLNDLLRETCPFQVEGSVISVSPVSWLLGGQGTAFLSGEGNPAWDELNHEDLFCLHENLVVRDTLGAFQRVRSMTSLDKFPDWAWKKRLILQMKTFLHEDLPELKSSAERKHEMVARILLGRVLEDLLRLGFTLNRKYLPWRTHLRWAFERLPQLADRALPLFDSILSAPDWPAKLEGIQALRSFYVDHITAKDLLPEVDFNAHDLAGELIWAERLEAWRNPNWRSWIARFQEKARKAGREDSWWVWSLWKWD